MATGELQLGEAVLRRLFLNKLPLHIQRQLSAMWDVNLDDLAKRADEAYEVSHYLGPASRTGTGPSSQRPGREQTPSSPEQRYDSNLCFYHERYGNRARHCKPPCVWRNRPLAASGNETAPGQQSGALLEPRQTEHPP